MVTLWSFQNFNMFSGVLGSLWTDESMYLCIMIMHVFWCLGVLFQIYKMVPDESIACIQITEDNV